MGSFSALLLILVFLVIGATLAILLLAVLRETLFWYWRSKGVMQEPEDILNRPHETALIIRKSIAGMKLGLAPGANNRVPTAKSAAAENNPPPHPGFSDTTP